MNIGLELLAGNLGFSLSSLIFMILIIASIIFFATDFKIGIVIEIILNSSLFMWFYSQNWNYVQPLAAFMISIVLLSISIFMMDKTQKGVFV